MGDAPCLVFAALAAWAGMGFVALSLEVHWRQVTEAPQTQSSRKLLRILGAANLMGALILCLMADHASMAALVWVMLLAAAAFAVSMLLTWMPVSLRPLTLFCACRKFS